MPDHKAPSTLATIRTRQGAGGLTYEVTLRLSPQKSVRRMFRRLGEARLWVQQQEKLLRSAVAPVQIDPVP